MLQQAIRDSSRTYEPPMSSMAIASDSCTQSNQGPPLILLGSPKGVAKIDHHCQCEPASHEEA